MSRMTTRAATAALLALALVAAGLGAAGAQPAAPAQTTTIYLPLLRGAPGQPAAASFWGMNLYLTKRERIRAGDNLDELARLARAAGVQWTREELPWDLIEPRDDQFSTVYDESLRLAATKGFGIVGMLLTTPAWARDGSCAANYWCPPANVAEFAEYAGWMAERYDGDGNADAAGSPRVAYWQIWNEPNDTALWPDLPGGADARKKRYGDMLVAAYAAIKAADPSARVLIGGTYIYNGTCDGGICDGFNFLNFEGGVFRQVPAARQAFDIFAIHPYISTARPDDPGIPRIITVQGRIRNTRAWLNDPAIGRSDAPIWVTEIGWCTTGGTCPAGVAVSEAQQASYLVRSLVIAQQNGAQHVSWFQFEDAFDDPGRVWANAAIVRRLSGGTYPAKPAYTAYATLAAQLGAATPAGTGPAHTHSYDPANPNVGAGGVYDYRYTRGAETVDVLWVPTGAARVALSVPAGAAVTRVTIDGASAPLTPSGGAVTLDLSEQPIIVVQSR